MKRIFLSYVMLAIVCTVYSAEAAVFTYQAGSMDGFSLPADAASPSAALVTSVGANTDHSQSTQLQFFQDFDLIANVNGGSNNRAVGHTFSGLPTGITGASLEFSVQAGYDPSVWSDQILFSFVQSSTDNWVDTLAWFRPFGPRDYNSFINNQWNLLYSDPGMLASWVGGDVATFTLDLSALPLYDGTFLNLIPDLNTYGFLDIIVEDETGVDYYALTINAVPLPPSVFFFATGLFFLVGFRRTKK